MVCSANGVFCQCYASAFVIQVLMVLQLYVMLLANGVLCCMYVCSADCMFSPMYVLPILVVPIVCRLEYVAPINT